MPRSGNQPSVMKHQFSMVPRAEIPRSSFDRSHGHKSTFDSGLLIPYFIDEALPGDTFKVRSTLFSRMATPIFPIMDNLMQDTQFFAVPIRLVWENWQKFNGEQANPADSTDFLIPQMVSPGGGYAENSLSDYMGIPPGVAGLSHSSLWHRAYNLIYNEWYRDQNLIDSVVVDKDDGPDDPADYTVLRRGKRHDYFTSCLPFPQKGESVTIPLGTKAPVLGLGKDDATYGDDYANRIETGGTIGSGTMNAALINDTPTGSQLYVQENPDLLGTPNIFADLTNAASATINELRQSFQVQKMFERDARGGSRYTEIIKSHFGVTSPDARLQRPEFLGGGSGNIAVTPVPQTSESDVSGPDSSPQGNLAAFATGISHEHGFTKSFTEHCLLIGIISIRADLSYQQGLSRMFSRLTRFDFYWPALSHIGEQAVLNKEIFAQGTGDPIADEAVFGFQERYAEYRYKPSIITGRFRSSSTLSLDAWHLAQDFAALPVLDQTFISENPPVGRVIAVVDEPEFIFDSYTKMHCARPMPVYGVPGLIDHF